MQQWGCCCNMKKAPCFSSAIFVSTDVILFQVNRTPANLKYRLRSIGEYGNELLLQVLVDGQNNVRGVLCLTSRGNLLLQTDRTVDLSGMFPICIQTRSNCWRCYCGCMYCWVYSIAGYLWWLQTRQRLCGCCTTPRYMAEQGQCWQVCDVHTVFSWLIVFYRKEVLMSRVLTEKDLIDSCTVTADSPDRMVYARLLTEADFPSYYKLIQVCWLQFILFIDNIFIIILIWC